MQRCKKGRARWIQTVDRNIFRKIYLKCQKHLHDFMHGTSNIGATHLVTLRHCCWLFVLGSLTYVVAECRLDSLMSVVFLEGESSSTGEMKPSPSSSMWSRKLSTLRSGRTLTVNCVLVSPSSSEPSSSSCPGSTRGQMMSKGGGNGLSTPSHYDERRSGSGMKIVTC